MKLQVVSDLHLEMFEGDTPLKNIFDNKSADAIAIAGDLCQSDGVFRFLREIDRIAQKPIFYIAGNHDCYGSSIFRFRQWLRQMLVETDIHFLENEAFEFGGKRILGTTLWVPFDQRSLMYKRGLPDYSYIQDYEKDTFLANEKARHFLEQNLKEGDIVITHHLPTYMSVHPRYHNNPLNFFFVCDMEKLILDRIPAMWIHGHTHESCDYILGETRIVCNPFGYICGEVNQNFCEKIIEV